MGLKSSYSSPRAPGAGGIYLMPTPFSISSRYYMSEQNLQHFLWSTEEFEYSSKMHSSNYLSIHLSIYSLIHLAFTEWLSCLERCFGQGLIPTDLPPHFSVTYKHSLVSTQPFKPGSEPGSNSPSNLGQNQVSFQLLLELSLYSTPVLRTGVLRTPQVVRTPQVLRNLWT